jgi:peptidyl-prolyl cis-trans isomerase D
MPRLNQTFARTPETPVMMETLRNAAKSLVAKILLGLLVLSFAVWGIGDMFRGFQAADLATVGESAISSEAFRVQLNQTMQRMTQQTGQQVTLEDARKIGLPQQILDRMIAQTAIDDMGEKLQLHVSNNAIIAEVQANKAFHNAQGQFDPQRFRIVLQQNGLTEEGFLASERQARLRAAIAGAAANGPTVPATLLQAMLQYRDETRDARYFTFPVSEADVPAPTDADLKKQYELAPAAYTAPEYRSIVVMKVELGDLAGKLQTTDAEVQEYYAAHMQDYFTPEKRTIIQVSFPDVAKAEAAKARIDKGEDIVVIAKEMGMKEADITFTDWTKDKFLDPAIGDAAFALAPGAVSAPVKGTLNTALLKAVAVSPEKQATLDEVKDKVRATVQLEKARDEIQAVFDAVEDARAQQTKFEDIAARAGIPILVIPAISQVGRDPSGAEISVPNKQEVLKAVYASDAGVENDAISYNDGYIWYEVRGVTPSAVKPLDQVKDAVRADYVAAKLRTLASDKAKAMIEKAGSNTKLETLAAENNATIQTATAMKRNQVSEAFDGVAAMALFASPPGSLTWALEGDGKSARIIEVGKSTVPAFSAVSVASKEVIDFVRPGLSQDLETQFIKAVRGHAQVSINEELWRQISSANTPP